MTTAMDTDWDTNNKNPATNRRRTLLFDVVAGILLGTIAGMATFVDGWSTFVAIGIDPAVFSAIILAAGALSYIITPTLRRSIRLFLVAFIVGMAVIVGSYVLPAYILPYRDGFRDLLVPRLVGDALGNAFYFYAPLFIGSYLFALCTFSLFE